LNCSKNFILIGLIQEKDKTTFKIAYNRARKVKCTVLKVEEGDLSDFRVQRGKTDFHKNEREKVDFFVQLGTIRPCRSLTKVRPNPHDICAH
jgi:hypothetical protein